MILIIIFSFVALYVVPRDPALVLIGTAGGQAEREALRRRLGLDAAIPLQAARYIGRLLRGDFGVSLVTGNDVATEIRTRLSTTATVVGAALALATVVSAGLGVVATSGARTRRRFVYAAEVLGAVPVLIIAGSLLLCSVWLSLGGYSFGLPDVIPLHVVSLSLPSVGLLTAHLWRAYGEAVGTDYVRTARALGLREWTIRWKYIGRNLAVRYLAVLYAQILLAFTGTFFIEIVFNRPGVSVYLVDAVLANDYPVIAAVSIVVLIVLSVVRTTLDTALTSLDPRAGSGRAISA